LSCFGGALPVDDEALAGSLLDFEARVAPELGHVLLEAALLFRVLRFLSSASLIDDF
jgi:hypothetical protein